VTATDRRRRNRVLPGRPGDELEHLVVDDEPDLRAPTAPWWDIGLRVQLALVVLASACLTGGYLLLRERADGRRDAEAVARLRRQATIEHAPPPIASPVWQIEEEAPLDEWSAWQMATFRADEGVVCWRFLVLPRDAPRDVAFRLSLGQAACSFDRTQRYSRSPRARACDFLRSVPPWRDRFVPADHFERSACAPVRS
jgi:hypothetical protein